MITVEKSMIFYEKKGASNKGLVPEDYELTITKNKPEIIELRNEEYPDNKITFEDGRLIKRSTSLSLHNKKQLGETSNTKEIKLHRNAGNMKIEGGYFNGKEHVNDQIY